MGCVHFDLICRFIVYVVVKIKNDIPFHSEIKIISNSVNIYSILICCLITSWKGKSDADLSFLISYWSSIFIFLSSSWYLLLILHIPFLDKGANYTSCKKDFLFFILFSLFFLFG